LKKMSICDFRRKGMSLALVLVVLLVAGAMVAVSMYFIENMISTTQMKLDNELRMNAAIAGLEKGKQWILDEIKKEEASELKPLPVVSIDVTGDFDDLKLKSFSDTVGDIPVETDIFFLLYTASEDVEFRKGMPPMVSILDPNADSESSQAQRQSYDASNRGGGSPEDAFSGGALYQAYLIRSTAEINGIEKTVEQAIYLKE
jgi:hypothetical protein